MLAAQRPEPLIGRARAGPLNAHHSSHNVRTSHRINPLTAAAGSGDGHDFGLCELRRWRCPGCDGEHGGLGLADAARASFDAKLDNLRDGFLRLPSIFDMIDAMEAGEDQEEVDRLMRKANRPPAVVGVRPEPSSSPRALTSPAPTNGTTTSSGSSIAANGRGGPSRRSKRSADASPSYFASRRAVSRTSATSAGSRRPSSSRSRTTDWSATSTTRRSSRRLDRSGSSDRHPTIEVMVRVRRDEAGDGPLRRCIDPRTQVLRHDGALLVTFRVLKRRSGYRSA